MPTIGKAHLDIIPKFPGLGRAVTDELGRVDGVAAGAKTAAGFGRGMAGAGVIAGAAASLVTAVAGSVSASMGAAMARFDTLNNYPRVMEQLGYSTDFADASIDRMSDHLSGLPTALDSMVSTVQGIADATGDLGKATDAGLALNDMLIASGSGMQLTAAATEQFRQMLAKGRPEMQDWKSLTQAMPGQLDQLAKSMLGPTANANDLYAALGGGGADATASMGELLDSMIRLDREGGDGFVSFEEQARTASDGVQTSMANIRTAVVRGVAGVMEEVGKDEIAGVLSGVRDGVNETSEVVRGAVAEAKPVVKDVVQVVSGIAPAVVPAAAGVLGLAASVSGLKSGAAVLAGVKGSFSAVAQTFKKGSETAGFAMLQLSEKVKAGGRAQGLLESASMRLGGVSGGALAVGLGVAAATAGVLVATYLDAKKRSEDMEQATVGLAEAASRTASLGSYAETVEGIGAKASGSALSVDGLAESMAKASASMGEVAGEAEADIATLNTVQEVISECAGKADLSAEAQGRLEWALRLANEQFGLSITAADAMAGEYTDANGEVVNLTESIDGLIDAKKREIQVEALTANLSTAYEARASAAEALAAAQSAAAEAQREYDEAVAAGLSGDALGALQSELDGANYELERASELYEGTEDACREFEVALGDESRMAAEGMDALDKLCDSTGALLDAHLKGSGGVAAFKDDLRRLGASTEDLADLEESELLAIADAYDGTATSIADALLKAGVEVENYNEVILEEKRASASVETSSLDIAMRKRKQWNEGQLKSHYAQMVVDIVASMSGRAAGGIRLDAAGGFVPRYHADGAIATRAVPLDIVGEAGAEAIVPLTNRRYAQPFVDMIADGVSERGASRQDVALLVDIAEQLLREVREKELSVSLDSRPLTQAVNRENARLASGYVGR